jgi:hypothetical protein
VIDVRDTEFSFADYAKYGFQDVSDLKDPVDMREYLQNEYKLPANHDVGLFEEAQQFIRRRGRFLRNRGDLSAWQIESLIREKTRWAEFFRGAGEAEARLTFGRSARLSTPFGGGQP